MVKKKSIKKISLEIQNDIAAKKTKHLKRLLDATNSLDKDIEDSIDHVLDIVNGLKDSFQFKSVKLESREIQVYSPEACALSQISEVDELDVDQTGRENTSSQICKLYEVHNKNQLDEKNTSPQTLKIDEALHEDQESTSSHASKVDEILEKDQTNEKNELPQIKVDEIDENQTDGKSTAPQINKVGDVLHKDQTDVRITSPQVKETNNEIQILIIEVMVDCVERPYFQPILENAAFGTQTIYIFEVNGDWSKNLKELTESTLYCSPTSQEVNRHRRAQIDDSCESSNSVVASTSSAINDAPKKSEEDKLSKYDNVEGESSTSWSKVSSEESENLEKTCESSNSVVASTFSAIVDAPKNSEEDKLSKYDNVEVESSTSRRKKSPEESENLEKTASAPIDSNSVTESLSKESQEDNQLSNHNVEVELTTSLSRNFESGQSETQNASSYDYSSAYTMSAPSVGYYEADSESEVTYVTVRHSDEEAEAKSKSEGEETEVYNNISKNNQENEEATNENNEDGNYHDNNSDTSVSSADSVSESGCSSSYLQSDGQGGNETNFSSSLVSINTEDNESDMEGVIYETVSAGSSEVSEAASSTFDASSYDSADKLLFNSSGSDDDDDDDDEDSSCDSGSVSSESSSSISEHLIKEMETTPSCPVLSALSETDMSTAYQGNTKTDDDVQEMNNKSNTNHNDNNDDVVKETSYQAVVDVQEMNNKSNTNHNDNNDDVVKETSYQAVVTNECKSKEEYHSDSSKTGDRYSIVGEINLS